MKKLSKSMLTLIVVLSLLFAMAITVFAASWSDGGEFKNRYGSGKYGVTMTLTEDKATASLSVSDYFGVVEEGGGAKIEGMLISDGYVSLSRASTIGEDIYKAYLNIDSSNGFDPNMDYDEFICLFTFYDLPVTNHVIYK